MEFVQQNNPGPSPFHDMYPEGSGRYGLHHVAVFVDDVDAALAEFEAQGSPTAMRAEMADGFIYAFADTSAALGHMTELYSPRPSLLGFYAMVADAAREGAPSSDLITTIRLR